MNTQSIIKSSRDFIIYGLSSLLLVLSGNARAETFQHAGPILQDTTWNSGDEHIVVGDVTVYPQVTLTGLWHFWPLGKVRNISDLDA